jgi:heme/copper-type cytochrome/quinol oxidase subunit 3
MTSLLVESPGFVFPTRASRPVVPSNLFATLVFVLTEIMFFAALISAFLIIKGNNPGFALPDGIILPLMLTSINTLILTVSGILLFFCGRALRRGAAIAQVERLLLGSLIGGIIFVSIQGFEWIQLIRFGMTMRSSIFGGCFFLLIGAHGLHVVGALLAMTFVWRILRSGRLRLDHIHSMQAFWFFVVGIWPMLYWLVYF